MWRSPAVRALSSSEIRSSTRSTQSNEKGREARSLLTLCIASVAGCYFAPFLARRRLCAASNAVPAPKVSSVAGSGV